MDQLTNFVVVIVVFCIVSKFCMWHLWISWHPHPSLLLSDYHKFWYSINISRVEKNSSDYNPWSVIKYLTRQSKWNSLWVDIKIWIIIRTRKESVSKINLLLWKRFWQNRQWYFIICDQEISMCCIRNIIKTCCIIQISYFFPKINTPKYFGLKILIKYYLECSWCVITTFTLKVN